MSKFPRNWHYCLHCTFKTSYEGAVKQHLRTAHGLVGYLKPGEDYTDSNGWMLLTKERQEAHEGLLDRFARQMASITSAEEFIFEVGDGLPEGCDDDDG